MLTYVVSPLKHRFNGTNIWYISFSPPILRWQKRATARVTTIRAIQPRGFDLTPGKVKRFLSYVASRLALRSAHPLINVYQEHFTWRKQPSPCHIHYCYTHICSKFQRIQHQCVFLCYICGGNSDFFSTGTSNTI